MSEQQILPGADGAGSKGANAGPADPAKPAAKKAKAIEVVVVRGTLHCGAVEHAGGHARDRKVTEHGPGSRLRLPEDEAKALIERGVVRLPEAAAKADPTE